MRLKKSLGQHFLYNKRLLNKIAEFVAPENNVVVEIGAGEGTLTDYLRSAKRLYVVEKDSRFCDILAKKYSEFGNVEVICADALTLDLTNFGSNDLVLCGNIPYYISSELISVLVRYRHLVKRAVFLVQREFARRVIASPGTKAYGSLSVLAQMYFEVEARLSISGASFVPPAKVASSVLIFKRRENDFARDVTSDFFRFVQRMFSYRRKKISNALRNIGRGAAVERVSADVLEKRIEQLSVKDILNLYKVVNYEDEI